MDLGFLLLGGVVVVLVTYLAISVLGPRYSQGDSEIKLLLNESMQYKLHVSLLVGVLATVGFALSVVVAGFLATDVQSSLAAL